jgi:DNA-directed RNA polymerase subunit beta
VRDVHYTHYGRLCTIETPEGPNIGLISTLCTHAKINKMGFLETPYRRVANGKVVMEGDVEYLSAEAEDYMKIAQANTPVTEDRRLPRRSREVPRTRRLPDPQPEEVEYMDVAPNQIVGVSAS